jgi:hypothetical protein
MVRGRLRPIKTKKITLPHVNLTHYRFFKTPFATNAVNLLRYEVFSTLYISAVRGTGL